jgi:NAD(P)-dependent dehydrogenase (short-subunit alcohol dehydrogenase family)
MATAGRTAIVTGAARGIGRELCIRLASEGANVLAVDILECAETLALISGPGENSSLVCDITSPEEVGRLSQAVADRHERCDILVNNAGIYPLTPFDDLSFEQWRQILTVNLDSMILLTMAFVPGMKAAGWGRIVNMGSSITQLQVRDQVPYITSKGAVHALTRALANEFGENGITVNALAPSIVPTEGIYARPGGFDGMTNDEELDLVSSFQTIKRRSTPKDLANVLAFVVSDEADFITGQILHVSGGLVRSGA